MNHASVIQAIINYITNPANVVSIGTNPTHALQNIQGFINNAVPAIDSNNKDGNNGNGIVGVGGIVAPETIESSVVNDGNGVVGVGGV